MGKQLFINKWSLMLWVVMGALGYLHAQAPQFTQLYNHPTYHNPALAGEMGHSRISLSHRNQWRGIYNSAIPLRRMPFQTTYFSFDSYNEDHHIGFGSYIYRDEMGHQANNTSLAVQGSYSWPHPFLGNDQDAESFEIGGGLSVTATQFIIKSSRFGNLTFVDQFTAAGPVNPSLDPYALNGKDEVSVTDWGWPLVSFGFVYKYFKNRKETNSNGIVFGGAFHEMKRALYPIWWNAHFTYRYGFLEDDNNLTLSAFYKWSGPKDVVTRQLDIVANYRFPILRNSLDEYTTVIQLGGGIRAMPWRKALDTGLHRDALLLMLGGEYGAWRLSASYDFTISTLRQRTSNGTIAPGSFELSAVWSLPRFFKKGGHNKNTPKTFIKSNIHDDPYDSKCVPSETKIYMSI